MSKSAEEKARIERLIFFEFAKSANLSHDLKVDLASIQSNDPPAPDVSCRIAGNLHYFEMTEITDNDLAKNVNISRREGVITGGAFSQDKPLFKAISNKSQKSYLGLDGPLELLAYYEKQYPPAFCMTKKQADLWW